MSTDRGLCGGLNINEFRQTIIDMKKWHDQNVECEASIIGSKGISFFSRVKLCRIVSHASGLGEDPGADDVVGTVTNMLKEFAAGNIDRVYLVFNKFVNTMVQKPVFQQLLPLPQNDKDDDKYGSVAKSHWDYIYEPNAKSVIDDLLNGQLDSISALIYRFKGINDDYNELRWTWSYRLILDYYGIEALDDKALDQIHTDYINARRKWIDLIREDAQKEFMLGDVEQEVYDDFIGQLDREVDFEDRRLYM